MKLAIRSILLASVLAWSLAALAGEAVQPSAPLDEAKLIAVLKSDAPQFDKAEACRLLQRCATQAAVPALAALLGDEKLSHMALYALEPLPDPAADEALRAALGTTKAVVLRAVTIWTLTLMLGIKSLASPSMPQITCPTERLPSATTCSAGMRTFPAQWRSGRPSQSMITGCPFWILPRSGSSTYALSCIFPGS